ECTAALATRTEQPLARGTLDHLRSLAEAGASSAGTAATVTDVTVLPGVGIEGVVDGHSLKVISVSAAAEQADLGPELADWTSAQAQAQRTIVVVVDDGTPLAGFALSDDIKTDAIASVERLRALGLRTVLLTGDSSAPAGVIAERIGTDEVIAEVLPGDKAAVVTSLQEDGHRVAMVGD